MKNVRILQQLGARPRFSPDGTLLVFDRPNEDNLTDVYITDLDGNITASLTDHKPGIPQRNNGNAIFDKSGQFVIFVSEAEDHYPVTPFSTNSGIGLYSNFWATDLQGSHFWQLSDVPIKQTASDGIQSYAVVNPLFSLDGKTLFWTERYKDKPQDNWGYWRIMAADYSAEGGQPALSNTRIVYVPPPQGNYVTAMSFESPTQMLVAGNLDGQDEYGMDQYLIDISTGSIMKDLSGNSSRWDEDSYVAPNDLIVYMSNKDSKYQFNFSNPDYQLQPITREYYLTDPNAAFTERLTYFNDPTAPEYLGRLISCSEVNIRGDGLFLASTLGVDVATYPKSDRQQKVLLLEFSVPVKTSTILSASGGPTVAAGSIVSSYGVDLGKSEAAATQVPLPTSLGGTTISVTDSLGVSRPASLFFTSGGQVNFLMPDDMATGNATIIVRNSSGEQVRGTAEIDSVAPGFFSADSSGRGVAAAQTVRIAPNGSQTTGLTASCTAGAGCKPVPISLKTDQVYLVLYGTGIRGRRSLSGVTATVGGVKAHVAYAGSQNGLAGLDQVNILLPASLAGAGVVNVSVAVDGKTSNTVQIQLQ